MDATSDRMISIYRKRAKRYDMTSNRLYVVGQRTMAYKRTAIEQLDLSPGDTVVDAGCGTGHNLPHLAEAVGPTGRVIGVDLTDAMLARAEERIRDHGLTNVSLVQDNLATYKVPRDTKGIIACYSLTLIDQFQEIIADGFDALAPGGRYVVLDYKLPRWWPDAFVPLMKPMIAPFGGDLTMVRRKPFETVQRCAERYWRIDRYLGWVYVATGVKGGAAQG